MEFGLSSRGLVVSRKSKNAEPAVFWIWSFLSYCFISNSLGFDLYQAVGPILFIALELVPSGGLELAGSVARPRSTR